MESLYARTVHILARLRLRRKEDKMNTLLYESNDSFAGGMRDEDDQQQPSGAGAANLTIPFTKTILVVDDEPTDIFLLARALSPVIASCRFLTAGDGLEAKGLLQRIRDSGDSSLPSVIFSDVRMPYHDGFELLEWLKRKPEYASIPVVMISTFDNPSDKEKAIALGAAFCLHKPPVPGTIQDLTQRLLQGPPPQIHRQREDQRQQKSHRQRGHQQHWNVPAPSAAAATPMAASCPWPQPQPPTRKILLADDDSSVREMLGRVLESEHYEVIYAKNGNEAAAKSVSGQPDMVLLDLNMPDRDGWSAFRFMNAAHPLLPVIVITARPNQYTQARELGIDALMEKPLNLPLLLKTIEGLLSETDLERTRRITNPHFKTALLGERIGSRK